MAAKIPYGDFPAGLSQPALRALAGAGIHSLVQLAKFSEAEIGRLHGMGPNGLKKLREALAARGQSFAAGKRGNSSRSGSLKHRGE